MRYIGITPWNCPDGHWPDAQSEVAYNRHAQRGIAKVLEGYVPTPEQLDKHVVAWNMERWSDAEAERRKWQFLREDY